MLQADNCARQVHHLQSLTAPPGSLPYSPNACFCMNMPDLRVEREGLWQYSVSGATWNSYGFRSALEMPFVKRIYKTLSGNCVKTVIVAQGVPNGVSQHFLGALVNKLQLTTKGAVVPNGGELVQNCIFKLRKSVRFFQVDR